ncbi:MAG TPA: DUF1572 domain-containing protein [Terriglobales bacterium]|jgi:hypothetical protein
MAHKFSTSYLEDSIAIFHHYKRLAEGAMAQVPDEQLFATLDQEMNSIAIVVKHMTGNMRSRFTDFLTSDGEKPDRHRDNEFETPPQSREALMKLWEENWNVLFTALGELTEEDLTRSIPIRGEAHSVMQAINRQVAHYAYHIGQIIFLAKHLSSNQWKALTVPRGKSEEFNKKVLNKEISQR